MKTPDSRCTCRWIPRVWMSLFVLLFLSGCDFGGPPSPSRESPKKSPELTAAFREKGKKLYQKQCASCHGASGRADGQASYLLYPRPRDLTGGSFRLASTDNGPTDEDLFRTISRGMPGSAMPPWDHLPADDRWALVAEVRRLTREGQVEDLLQDDRSMDRKEAEQIVTEIFQPGEFANVPREPPVTVESLARGKVLYLQNCAPCHDADGRGRSRRDLKDSDGHPIFARDFTQGIFKGSSEGKQLAYRILAGMPGSPMPGYSGIFQNKPKDLWAIIHHIQSLVPEGAQERVAQKRRRIQVVRVSTALTTDPRVSIWEKASPTYVVLMPLWWKDERVEGVIVRALYDGQRIAIRLTWVDPTEDRLALRSQDFGDGAAMQFSTEADPPFFAMGGGEGSVAIWHWKAHWESDLAGYKDVEDAYPRTVVDHYPSAQNPVPGALMTADNVPAVSVHPEFLTALAAGNLMANLARTSSVENLSARGFGTLTSNKLSTQTIQGASRWEGGAWDVVFLRSLRTEEDDVEFSPGGPELSIAFAIWDGSAGDRNGQKSVTIWHSLKIEK